MIQALGKLIYFIVNGVELAVFTLVMNGLSRLRRLRDSPIYFTLFRVWCRSFVRALRVDLICACIKKMSQPCPSATF